MLSSFSLSFLPLLTLMTDPAGLAPPPLAHEPVPARAAAAPAATPAPAPAPVSATAAVMEEAAAATPAPPYAGLSLAPAGKNPLPTPKEAPPRLMWTGFSPSDTGGEIFLQTTRGVTHDIAVTTGKDGKPSVSVFLRNCRIHWRNNARRIDTRFFATAVAGVVARQRKRDVEISIALKQPATPSVRTAPGADGTEMLVLSFPAGERAEPAPTTVSAR